MIYLYDFEGGVRLSMLLEILDKNGIILASQYGKSNGYLLYEHKYKIGDQIHLRLQDEKIPTYKLISVDSSLSPSLVYLTQQDWCYDVPFDNGREIMPAMAFAGEQHFVNVSKPTNVEIYEYQNLALNAHDQKNDHDAFPHAHSNFETRNDATFAARNAIDGYVANDHHGSFPYQSWGIDKRSDAAFHLDFGREVQINKIGIFLRCDFPHDSYWINGTIRFSNGQHIKLFFKKTCYEQVFNFTKMKVHGLIFKDLIKNDDESPFPALIEMKVYGVNIKAN